MTIYTILIYANGNNELEPEILNTIKRLFNDIAYYYLTNEDENLEISPIDLFTPSSTTRHWPGFIGLIKDISQYSERLIIHQKKKSTAQGNITFAQKYLSDTNQLLLYDKLAFAKDNYWTNLLSIKLPHSNVSTDIDIHPEPMILPLQVVYSYISMLNSNLTNDEKKDLLRKLYHYKKWDPNHG